MRKFSLLLLSICFLSSLFACSEESEINAYNTIETKHLMVNGKPFLMLGAQLRTDFFLGLDNKTPDDLAPYFELAAKMNVLVVQVPVAWSDVEVEKDIYKTELVEKYIELCDRYQLKLEILWFGSYMCGISVGGYIPDYVENDNSTYPELNPDADYIADSVGGWFGKRFWLKPNTPALVERESKALKQMMEAIYHYDSSHGQKHTVIGIQVENEPDILATRHNQDHGYTPEQIWPDLISMLDQLGQVVKNSPYDCYTRVNQTNPYPDYMERSAEIAATAGIDYVGLDPYQNKLSQIDSNLRRLRKIKDNYGHIAENGGEYVNNDLLTLKALSLGCGYEIFEVITSTSPKLEARGLTIRGVYNPDFTPKPHTQRIVDAFKIFKGAWVDLASADAKDIIGFNLKHDDGLNQTSEYQNTTHAGIKWSTGSRGVAFAVERNNYLVVASTQNDQMTFRNIQIKNIEKGYYDINGNWVSDGKMTPTGNQLSLEPCIVYKIQF